MLTLAQSAHMIWQLYYWYLEPFPPIGGSGCTLGLNSDLVCPALKNHQMMMKGEEKRLREKGETGREERKKKVSLVRMSRIAVGDNNKPLSHTENHRKTQYVSRNKLFHYMRTKNGRITRQN
jgi:hypothetical protein